MANKKFWVGMLVMVLVFGMAVIGCDNGTTNGNGGGYVTIYNIPAGFDGGFAILGLSDLTPFYVGAANINPNTLNITLLPISNGSVRLPMWKLDYTFEDDYPYDFSIDAVTRLTRTGTPEGFYGDGADPVLMIYSQSSLRVPSLWGEGTSTGTVLIARYWSGITFTNGSATLCWNDSFHWDW